MGLDLFCQGHSMCLPFRYYHNFSPLRYLFYTNRGGRYQAVIQSDIIASSRGCGYYLYGDTGDTGGAVSQRPLIYGVGITFKNKRTRTNKD